MRQAAWRELVIDADASSSPACTPMSSTNATRRLAAPPPKQAKVPRTKANVVKTSARMPHRQHHLPSREAKCSLPHAHTTSHDTNVTKAKAEGAFHEAKLAKLMAKPPRTECNEAKYNTNATRLAVTLISWQSKGACSYAEETRSDTNEARLDTNEALHKADVTLHDATVASDVTTAARPAATTAIASSLRLPADPLAPHIHQRSRLDGSKLTGIEELPETDRTRLVPHRTIPSIEHSNHRCMAARAVHAPLFVATCARRHSRRVEQIDAFFRVHIGVLERVEPKAFARRASIDLRLLDLHHLHRRAALWTLDLHGVPSREWVSVQGRLAAHHAQRVRSVGALYHLKDGAFHEFER
jgi:hypothetical protein